MTRRHEGVQDLRGDVSRLPHEVTLAPTAPAVAPLYMFDPTRFPRELGDAIAQRALSLHFQPITSCRSGGVVGVEALVRWQHPHRGAISPGDFIPLAEKTGAIHSLGSWILRQACAQVRRWDAAGLAFPYVAVNVSPLQFRHPDFIRFVDEAIDEAGIGYDRLVVEITEGMLVDDLARARAIVEALNARGVRCALDDYGTGYSSLAYLQSLPLAKIKIDRRFIANLPDSHNDSIIVSSIIGMGRTLDLELVAEGVETIAQRDMLVRMGCDHIQGWLVCRALDPDTLAHRFATHELRLHRAARA